jgi:hypothetical protein
VGAGWHDRVISPAWEKDGLNPDVLGRPAPLYHLRDDMFQSRARLHEVDGC